MSAMVIGTLALFVSLTAFAAEDTDAQFKGYYKNLLMHSRTAFPRAEDYTLDLNRLRLELRGRPRPWLGYEIQYDNEALLGNYLQTAQFAQLKAAKPATYWDLDDDTLDRGSVYARHRLHRGYFQLAAPGVDVYFGRQRIAWGNGRFWNPTDLLNPYNPAQIEHEERPGADAALVETNLDALSKLSVVYTPQRATSASRALRYRANMSGTDVAVLAGKFRDGKVIGLEFAGRLGEAGVRGEAAHTNPAIGGDYTRTVFGFDYAFVNTLTLGAELYWNGQGTSDRRRYDFTALFAGAIQNVARRYAGAYLKHEFTPLLRTENNLIANLDDDSRFFAPSLVYSLTANWDWTVGTQRFHGAGDSEYGRFHDLYYTSWQWFF